MKELKLAFGALLMMLILPLLVYFGLGAVMLAFGSGDQPGWAVIFLLMFFLPLLFIFFSVRDHFGLSGVFGGPARRRRRPHSGKLTLPDGTEVDFPDET